MNRNPEFQFVSTDTDALIAELVAGYEAITGITVRPASPEKLFIQWVASVVLQERVLNNYTGNQNIPSRAAGSNLDVLGALFYEVERPKAQPAVCTIRFYISEAQNTAILIPAGTRVTGVSGSMIWATVEDVYVQIGETYVDVQARCSILGEAGNGYALGQINTIVDLYDYCSGCENITVSDEGADEATDEEYYELMRAGMDAFSTAGPLGGYIYFAKKVSTEIADVRPNSPIPGYVDIYVLMNDGTIAADEIKNAVYAACNEDQVRAFTDFVSVKDAEYVKYNISFTYYIQRGTNKSAKQIEEDVSAAVQNYVTWQRGKFGRDINPDKLREYLATTGIKRIVLNEPSFTKLRNGTDHTVPQVASIGEISIVSGGYEDE